MQTSRILVFAFTLALLAAACGEEHLGDTSTEVDVNDSTLGVVDENDAAFVYDVPSIQQAVEGIDGSIASLDSATGTWELGDASSRYVARFDGDEVVAIAEEMDMGEYGEGTAWYYFIDGGLVYYYDDMKHGAAGTSSRTVFFDEMGTVIESSKETGGEPSSLTETDVQEIIQHASELRNAAEGARTSGGADTTAPGT